MKKIIKIVAISLASIIGAIVVGAGSYLAYVSIQYSRIDQNLMLAIENDISTKASLNEEYTITTYNIGFGAYDHDFSFFMDSGKMLDGKEVSGKYGKAQSKDIALTNTNGAIDLLQEVEADFMLYQEVDKKASRSHKVNQYQMIKDNYVDYSSNFATNFDSAYLFYPFNDPHGKTLAGLATLSKYNVEKSIRYSFPVDESFPTKFFDLDRCFSISYLPIEGTDKYLCIANIHMSAYDKGGLIRQKQLEMLNSILKAEYDKGNYVVAGGDFNHDIASTLNTFTTQQYVPEWVFELSNDDLASGLSFAAASNAPTCRSTDMPYEKNINYTVTLDGFIVSDNVEVVEVLNIDNDFMFSDHNPAKLRFILK